MVLEQQNTNILIIRTICHTFLSLSALGHDNYFLFKNKLTTFCLNIRVNTYFKVYIYSMHAQDSKSYSNNFIKGMSLQEYMKDMNCPQIDDLSYQQAQIQANDLYLQSQPNQTSIANYAIREIDEDNYDQSLQQHLIIEPFHKYDLRKGRIVEVQEFTTKKNFYKKNDGKRRNLSNSPKKISENPKNDMFRSLYGNSFANSYLKESNQMLSTLGTNQWRRKRKSFNKKQAEFKDRNRRHYQQIIKYQNAITQRIDNKLQSIRIDGVKDKIHQRIPQKNNRAYREVKV